MTNQFIASRDILKEALSLSESILEEIELNTLPLTQIALKTSRLARLLGQFDYQNIFVYEASGYPTTPNGISHEVWSLAKLAGRVYQYKKDDELKERCKTASIETIESVLLGARERLAVSQDPHVSISSANPKQFVSSTSSNKLERNKLHSEIRDSAEFISARRAFIYRYVNDIYYQLKYSAIQDDIFSRIRSRVDSKFSLIVPDSIKKLSAIYENLLSDNDEDWSNAVHSCRRILQDVADVLYPPREDKDGIKLGKENYINRLIAYIETKSKSSMFTGVVGSHLKYIGERLDSIFYAAQKGSHAVISTQDEADRYVIYTYLILGDILSLYDEDKADKDELLGMTVDVAIMESAKSDEGASDPSSI